MFVVSVRASRIKSVLGIFLLGAILFLVMLAFAFLRKEEEILLPSEAERLVFLDERGFSATEENAVPTVIPSEWNDVYDEYNALQQTQGFDLDGLRGASVTRYIYPVGESGEVTLIIADGGRLVGADFYDYDSGEMTAVK